MCTDSLQQSGKGAHKNVLIKKKKKQNNVEKKKIVWLFFLQASKQMECMKNKRECSGIRDG